MILAAAIAAAGLAASLLLGAGILWAVVEIDDGRHDIFGGG